MALQQARLALTTSVGRGWGGAGWGSGLCTGIMVRLSFSFSKRKKTGKMACQFSVFLPEYQLDSLKPSVPMTRKNMGKWWQGKVRVTFSEALGAE